MAQEVETPLTKLLGTALTGKDGDVATSTLAGFDAIGLYFSAHWCPPCRGFTPKLIETYNTMKAAGKKFEIVFVSSDRDQKAFDEYYGEMPWLALKFEDRKSKAKLSKKFKVNGIPSFQIISPATGKVLTDDGRAAVSSDPTGDKFPGAPWQKPPKKPFFEMLGADFEFDGKEGKVSVATIQERSKYLMLYFSAHWCPPCKGFTPKFAEWYKKNQPLKVGTEQSFDAVFVSSDRDEKAFDDYWGEQPWMALPYSDRDLKGKISDAFDVQGIPTLVVLDTKTGALVSDGGRGGVMNDPEAAKFPWPKESCEFLSGSNIAPINDSAMLVIFVGDASEAEQEAALAAVKPKADLLMAKSKETDEAMEVEFRVDKKCDFTDRLKGLLAKRPEGTICAIINIGEQKGFAHPDIKSAADVTTKHITAFVDDFLAEKLEGFELSM